MTLLELCDPLFQFVCRLNRSARKGARPDLDPVRDEVKAIFADMRSRTGATPALIGQYEKVEIVLIFFVDFMIKSSALPNAGEWQELAYERKELAGDEKFFDLLDETLADKSEAASERLAVFYTCIGLGFTGWYTGQPEYLRRKMLECSTRIRAHVDSDHLAKICPESYEHVNTANLIEPPGSSLVGIGIALVGLVIVLFLANAYSYKSTSAKLTDSLKSIIASTGVGGK